MRTRNHGFAALCLLITASACDNQVDADYQGESMLRIQGSVTIPQEFATTELVPALTFGAVSDWQRANNPRPSGDHQRILDVGVTGEFPASFTLDVFDPPPAEAILEDFPGEPAYAMGYISAVPPDHPAAITRALTGEPPSSEDVLPLALRTCLFTGACDASCVYSPGACPPTCYEGSSYPPTDLAICHLQAFECHSDPNVDNCAFISASGNPSVEIAGYSRNVRILYYPEAIPADSLTAFLHGGRGAPISAGYHLQRQNPDAVPPSDPTCAGPVPWEMAVASYNSAHGTNLTLQDFSGPVIATAEYRELLRLQYIALRDLDCLYGGPSIEGSPTSPITIDLGARQPY
jgi:hypothetical protein